MTCGIYKLTSPSGKQYVGSAKNIRSRYCEHKRDARKGQHKNRALMRAIRKYGDLAIDVIIEIDEPYLIPAEQFFINWIEPEYNCSKIAGKVEFTTEVRQKISKALIGKSYPHPTMRGRKLSKEHCASLKASNVKYWLGKQHTEETKAKIASSLTGRTWSDERRAKQPKTNSLKGRPWSEAQRTANEEHLRELNASRKGKSWSAARRAACKPKNEQ